MIMISEVDGELAVGLTAQDGCGFEGVYVVVADVDGREAGLRVSGFEGQQRFDRQFGQSVVGDDQGL